MQPQQRAVVNRRDLLKQIGAAGIMAGAAVGGAAASRLLGDLAFAGELPAAAAPPAAAARVEDRASAIRISAVSPIISAGRVFVKIQTNQNVTGWGELKGIEPATAATLATSIAQILIGENPTRIEHLWQRMYRSHRNQRGGPFMVHTISAMDMALWDIAGKLHRTPVYRLLGGTAATATATVAGGVVTAITVTNGGTGYTTAPAVAIAGGDQFTFDAEPTCKTIEMPVLFWYDGGAVAYTVDHVNSLVDGSTVITGDPYGPNVSYSSGGTGATAIATVAGAVTAATIVNHGSGYTSAPGVVLTGGGGTGATATALVSGPVTAVTVTNGGMGYTDPPAVSFVGGGGTGATAVATIEGGAVSQIAVTNGGSAYTSAPAVTLTGGGGTGASATATAVTDILSEIIITNGGSGYTSAPAVTITGGDGTGGTATTSITTSVVSATTVTASGSGYATTPTVTISGGGGTGATATAAVAGSQVIDISITNGGSGYTAAPTVTITGGGGTADILADYAAAAFRKAGYALPLVAADSRWYHNSQGNIHCGTNVRRAIPAYLWWEN